MLDALVLADRAIENAPLAAVGARAGERITAKAHGFDTDQDAFRVEAVEKIFESFSLLADAVVVGDEKIVDEHRIRIDRAPAHLLDAPDLDLRAVEIGVKQRHSVGRFLAFAA